MLAMDRKPSKAKIVGTSHYSGGHVLAASVETVPYCVLSMFVKFFRTIPQMKRQSHCFSSLCNFYETLGAKTLT